MNAESAPKNEAISPRPDLDGVVEQQRRAADEAGGDRRHQRLERHLLGQGLLGPVPLGDVADDAEHLVVVAGHEPGLDPAGVEPGPGGVHVGLEPTGLEGRR